ncbi:MAG: dihydroorotase [candidate division Zixibacteria bacterium]|nr:dihydroorotase [candidate division Zixibacteria bacterium]
MTEGRETVVIRGGRIVDPATGRDETGDVWICDGRIAEPQANQSGATVIDATGQIVFPGLVDMRTHLREPGYEYQETIRTGTQAAAAGGYTAVVCLPDTSPPIDNAELVRFVRDEAGGADVRVHVAGAATRGRAGEQLAEIGEMAAAGIVAVSDDDRPIDHPAVMRRVFEYTRMFDLPVMTRCEDRRLIGEGVMHEGIMSTILGLKGMPAAAEESVVARDILLADLTGGRLHISGVSAAGSVEQIREARRKGIRITADVTPHHLVLTDEALRTYDTHLKVNPPLRTRRDRETLRAALAEGIIDAVASDHAPWSFDEKCVEYAAAPFGAIGLETTLAVVLTELVQPGHLTMLQAARALSLAPARILKLEAGTLRPGLPADVTVFDPQKNWTVCPEAFFSRSRNTPFDGRKLVGRTTWTVVGGRVLRWSETS